MSQCSISERELYSKLVLLCSICPSPDLRRFFTSLFSFSRFLSCFSGVLIPRFAICMRSVRLYCFYFIPKFYSTHQAGNSKIVCFLSSSVVCFIFAVRLVSLFVASHATCVGAVLSLDFQFCVVVSFSFFLCRGLYVLQNQVFMSRCLRKPFLLVAQFYCCSIPQ